MTKLKLAALVVFGSCSVSGGEGNGVGFEGERWEAADALFHHDAKWLGADGGATVRIDENRTLWLFGDTFVANTANRTRREADFVPSSIGVMTGNDPTTATMQFSYPAFGGYRPTSGIRVPNGPLVIFLVDDREGFTNGTYATWVADPSGPPDGWIFEEPIALPIDPIACATIDGSRVVAVSVDGSRRGQVIHWPIDQVDVVELASPKYTHTIFQGAGMSCSISFDASLQRWIYMYAGPTGTLDYRASRTDSIDEFLDPMRAYEQSPINRRMAVIRSAIAHDLGPVEYPAFSGTYVERPIAFEDLLDPEREDTLYWPHFVRFDYYEAVE